LIDHLYNFNDERFYTLPRNVQPGDTGKLATQDAGAFAGTPNAAPRFPDFGTSRYPFALGMDSSFGDR
jgi:hypothetical protein